MNTVELCEYLHLQIKPSFLCQETLVVCDNQFFFFLPFPYNPPCCRQMQWSYIPSFINLVLLLLFFLIIATNNKTKHFTYYAAFYASQNPSEILPPLNLPNILCDWQGKCCLSVWVRKLNWIAFQCRAQHPLPNPV